VPFLSGLVGSAQGGADSVTAHSLVFCGLRLIDCRFALTVAFEGLVAVDVMVGLTLKWSHSTLIALSSRLGDFYRTWIVGPWPQLVPPFVCPLALAAEELKAALTAAELRELVGSRRRVRKAELIAGWIAAYLLSPRDNSVQSPDLT